MASMLGLTNAAVPGQRVGHAVDVVPAAGVEADEVRAERGADLHQLEAGLELLDQHVDLDRADRQGRGAARARRACRSRAPLPRRSGSSAGRARSSGPRARSARVVVDHVQHEVDDRGREARAVGRADVAVVEVQAAGAEDARREVELPSPVGDDRAAEEAAAPSCSSRRRPARRRRGRRGSRRDRQLQVALVVERHRRDLAERVFAVEHPAVGAREQRVGDVAQARLERGARLGGRAGALDPLALEVGRDVAAVEAAGAGVADADLVPRMSASGSRKPMRRVRRCARSSRRAIRAAIRPSAVAVERRQGVAGRRAPPGCRRRGTSGGRGRGTEAYRFIADLRRGARRGECRTAAFILYQTGAGCRHSSGRRRGTAVAAGLLPARGDGGRGV